MTNPKPRSIATPPTPLPFSTHALIRLSRFCQTKNQSSRLFGGLSPSKSKPIEQVFQGNPGANIRRTSRVELDIEKQSTLRDAIAAIEELTRPKCMLVRLSLIKIGEDRGVT